MNQQQLPATLKRALVIGIIGAAIRLGSCITAYDCGGDSPPNITTVSLRHVGECDFNNVMPQMERKYIQLLQYTVYGWSLRLMGAFWSACANFLLHLGRDKTHNNRNQNKLNDENSTTLTEKDTATPATTQHNSTRFDMNVRQNEPAHYVPKSTSRSFSPYVSPFSQYPKLEGEHVTDNQTQSSASAPTYSRVSTYLLSESRDPAQLL